MDVKGAVTMDQPVRRWNGAWRSVTWASTRALWKKPTPEEEQRDAYTWREATCEHGSFVSVFWCEVRQLVGDVLPAEVHEELHELMGQSGPKTPEGR